MLKFSSFLVLEIFSSRKQQTNKLLQQTNRPNNRSHKPLLFWRLPSLTLLVFDSFVRKFFVLFAWSSLYCALNSLLSPPLTKGVMSGENTAGSCQWLLTVTWATSPSTFQFKFSLSFSFFLKTTWPLFKYSYTIIITKKILESANYKILITQQDMKYTVMGIIIVS